MRSIYGLTRSVAGVALVLTVFTVAGAGVAAVPAGTTVPPVPAAYLEATVVTDAGASPSVSVRGEQPPVQNADEAIYGPYLIYNFATKLCAEFPGNGAAANLAPLHQGVCAKTGTDGQDFVFLPQGTDKNGNQRYWIKSTVSGYCLDLPGVGKVAPGSVVAETVCLANDNQYFRLEPRFTTNGFQYYWLRNVVADDQCLDVTGVADTTPGVGLIVIPCLSDDDHEWALVEKSQWGAFGPAGAAAPASSSKFAIIVWVLVGVGILLIIGVAALLAVRLWRAREDRRSREAALRDQFWQPPAGGWNPSAGGQPQGNDEPTMFP